MKTNTKTQSREFVMLTKSVSGISLMLLISLVVFIIPATAQQNIFLTPTVQPTQGNHTQVGNFALDYTVGEPMQTTLQNGNVMLTQGFEQMEKPLPPVVPASQTVCSDTAVTFTWDSIQVGEGGDSIEWSLSSSFDTSYIISNFGSISFLGNDGKSDTVWMRSKVSATRCLSPTIYITAMLNVVSAPIVPNFKFVPLDSTANELAQLNEITAGTCGNQIEWALDSTFSDFHLLSSPCNLEFNLRPASDTAIWIRSRDSITGFTSHGILKKTENDRGVCVWRSWLFKRDVFDYSLRPFSESCVKVPSEPFYSCETAKMKVQGLINSSTLDGLKWDWSYDLNSPMLAVDCQVIDEVRMNFYNASLSTTPLVGKIIYTNDAHNYPFQFQASQPTEPNYIGGTWLQSGGHYWVQAEYSWHLNTMQGCSLPTNVVPTPIGFGNVTALEFQAWDPMDFTIDAPPTPCNGDEMCFTVTSNLNSDTYLSKMLWKVYVGDDPASLTDLYSEFADCNLPSPTCYCEATDCNGQFCYEFSTQGSYYVDLYASAADCLPTCPDIQCKAEKQFVINDSELSATISPSDVTETSCSDDVLTVSVSVTGGGAPYSYSWETTPGLTGNENNADLYIGTLATGIYNVTATDIFGCEITADLNFEMNCCIGDNVPSSTDTYTITDNGSPVTSNSITAGWFQSNSNTIAINGTLVIDNHFTISDCPDIVMGKNAKIIVKPEASLIIINSRLHSCSDFLWQGITIQGDPTQSQYPITGSGSSGTYHQGAVFMTDATIENAEIAVNLSLTDIGKRGGIIQAVNSSFINNRTDVFMLPYRNFTNNNNTANNASTFYGCHFTTNSALSSDDPNPNTHVLLYGVDGVKIKGCAFENTRTGLTYDYQLGNGIFAVDANFAVDDYCAAYSMGSCTDLKESTFSNLRHGVHIGSFLNPKVCYVRNSAFDHCLRAIRNEGVNFTRFTGNDIAVGNTATITDITNFDYALLDEGIILRQCIGFTVEGNYIHPALDNNDAPEVELTIGTRADGTGGQSNTIRNNTFEELFAANVANRQNRANPNVDITGLQYLCNQQTDDDYDICVTQATVGDPNGNSTGVGQNQGDATKAAGNTFSTAPAIDGNFFNRSPNHNNYFYYSNPPTEYSHATVTVTHTNDIDLCPSHSNNGANNFNHFLAGKSDNELQEQYTTYKASLVTEESLYRSRIDNGNTQRMLAFLDTSNYNYYAGQVIDTLLSASPYLSETALIKAAQMHNAISDSMLYEILLLNPDGIKASILIAEISRREMPDGWLDSAMLRKPTERTYLEDSIQKHASLKNEAAYELISRISLDEDTIDYTTLRQWLDSLQYPMADAYCALTYMQTAKPDTALSKLRSIHGRYDLSNEDSLQLNSIDTLLAYYTGWYNIQTDTILPGDVTTFDTTAIALFDSLASQKNEYLTGTQAVRNIMNAMFDRNYFTPAELPAEVFGKRDESETEETIKTASKQAQKENLQSIKVYPNPAKDYITFEAIGEVVNANIQIYDAYGQKITEIIMTQPILTVDTKQWGSGIYLWRVIYSDEKKGQGKISVLQW